MLIGVGYVKNIFLLHNRIIKCIFLRSKDSKWIVLMIAVVMAILCTGCANAVGSGFEVGVSEKVDFSYSEVQFIEEKSDEDESYYRVGAEFPTTDFSVISEYLSDMIEQEWNRWDNMTSEQRMLSSSIPGMISFDCETWTECEETIGLTIYNPLEGFDWLDKVGYFGMDVSGISHVQTTANSSSDGRELNDITITSGYNSEEIRVTLTAVVSSGDGTYTVGSACRGSARYDQKRVFSGTGIPVLVVITDGQNNLGYYNGVYYDPTAYWVRDNVFYTLRVTGERSEEKEIQELFDRIISEI